VHADEDSNVFFQRIEFSYADLLVGAQNTLILERAVGELGWGHCSYF
jgi:hypothetical protein